MSDILERPYSIDTLAERWGCSPSHIRKMVAAGDLTAFGIGGKLVRIAAAEVARIESGNIWKNQNTGSPGIGGSLQSRGTKAASDSAARWARLTKPSPRACSSSSPATRHDSKREAH